MVFASYMSEVTVVCVCVRFQPDPQWFLLATCPRSMLFVCVCCQPDQQRFFLATCPRSMLFVCVFPA